MLSFYPGNKRRRYTPHQELAQACPDRFHPMDPMDPMDPRACIRLLPQQRDLAKLIPCTQRLTFVHRDSGTLVLRPQVGLKQNKVIPFNTPIGNRPAKGERAFPPLDSENSIRTRDTTPAATQTRLPQHPVAV